MCFRELTYPVAASVSSPAATFAAENAPPSPGTARRNGTGEPGPVSAMVRATRRPRFIRGGRLAPPPLGDPGFSGPGARATSRRSPPRRFGTWAERDLSCDARGVAYAERWLSCDARHLACGE